MKRLFLLLFLALLLLPVPVTAAGRCCLTYAWSQATGISEDTFYAEASQRQATGCPSSWGASVVAQRHGWKVETAARFDWAHVEHWATRGGLILYALPQWPESWQGPDGFMHAYYCDAFDVMPPDYGSFFCYDICNPGGRWWNAQLMRDTWSGWALGVFEGGTSGD